MSIGNTGGGGVRPVRIEFEAKDGVSAPLQKMEESGNRFRTGLTDAFAAASRAIERTEKDTTKAGAGASTALDRWQAELRRTRQSYQDLEVVSKKAVTSFSKDLTNALQSAQQSLGQLSAGIKEFGEHTSQLTTVGNAFRSLSRDAGLSADELLASLKKSTRGQVDELELMKNANTAAFLSGKEILKQLPQLLEIAVASSKATGQSVEFLTQSLVTGIGRLSPRIIDNLGITVKLEQTNAAYAASIGKTVEQLSAQEQRQALVNEVLKQGEGMIRSIGAQTTTLGGQMKQTEVFITDLSDSLMKMTSESLGAFGPLIGTVGVVAGKISNLSGLLLAVNSIWQIGGASAVVWGGALTLAAGGVVTAIKETKEKLKDLPSAIEEACKAGGISFDELAKHANAARDAIREVAVKGVEGIPLVGPAVGAWNGVSDALDAVGEAATSAKDSLHDYNMQLGNSGKSGIALAFNPMFNPDFNPAANQPPKTNFLSGALGGIGAGLGAVGKGLDKKGVIDTLGQRLESHNEVMRRAAAEEAKIQRELSKERRAFEKEERAAEGRQKAAQKDFEKARKELLQAQLEDAKDLMAFLDDTIDATETFYSRGKDAVIDWSHSSRDAMAEYRAELQKTIDAQTAGAGLFDFSLSKFSLSKFGATARAKEAVGPPPEQNGFVKGTFDMFGGQGLIGSAFPIQQAITEYNRLRVVIQDLEPQLEKQPRSIAELEKAYASANQRLLEANNLTAESVDGLNVQVGAVDDALRPLKRTSDELNLAATGLQDVSGSISRIVISSDETAAALQRLKAAFDAFPNGTVSDFIGSMQNAEDAIKSLATVMETERLGRLKAFQDRFNATTNSFTWAIGQFATALNPGGAGSNAVNSFSSFLGTTTTGPNFAGFQNWFTATQNIITNSLQPSLSSLQTAIGTFNANLGVYAVTPATNFTAFKNYFATTLPVAVNESKLNFQAGGGGLVDSINDFNIYIGSQTQTPNFINFPLWFNTTLTGAIDTAQRALSNATTGLPASMGVLKASMSDFTNDQRVKDMKKVMDDLATSASTMSTAFGTMTLTTGSLAVAATMMGTLRDAAVPAKDAFVAMGTAGSGPVAATSKELGLLNTGGLTSANAGLGTLKTNTAAISDANANGAFYNLGVAIGLLQGKLGPGSTTGTLTNSLNLVAAPSGTGGSMDLIKAASASWQTSTATLKDDVATLAGSVVTLNSALLGLHNRPNAAEKLSIPDSRTQGDPQGTFEWQYMYSIMDPHDGYKSRNILRDTVLPGFQGSWVDMAEDLSAWWRTQGIPGPQGRSGGSGARSRSSFAGGGAGAAVGGGGDTHIHVHLHNPIMTHARAVNDLAERAVAIAGQRLKRKPGIARLTGGV